MTSLPFFKQCLVKVMFSETIRNGDFKRINYSIYNFVAALFRMVATLFQHCHCAKKTRIVFANRFDRVTVT